MKIRKPKTVKTEIRQREKELETLQFYFGKSTEAVAQIADQKSKLVYAARTGNQEAEKKCVPIRKEFTAAENTRDELAESIRQGEQMLVNLATELDRSKETAGLELMKKEGKSQVKIFTEVEEAVAVIKNGIHESRKGTDRLRKNLDALDFKPLNTGTEVKMGAARKISQEMHELFPKTGLLFEGTLSEYHRKTNLVELIKNCFGKFSNSPKKLLQNPDEGVTRVNLSDVRKVPSGEALLMAETRVQMKRDAAEMRKPVPA